MNKIQALTKDLYAQDENNSIARSKGITLIALVVTIIVLIILAAVTISLLLGSNGIISRAQQAARETRAAAFKEKIEMEIAAIVIKLSREGKEVNLTTVGEKLAELGYDVNPNPKGDGSITIEKDGGKAIIYPDLTVEVEGAPSQIEGGQTGETKDTTKPEVQISYSTTSPTTGTVIVTIEANEKIVEPPGWEAVDGTETKYKKEYTMNVTNEKIEISDIAGNKTIIQINISNIVTGELTGNITYNTTTVTHENVIATIETDREIQTPDGWTKQDNTHYTKEYNINVEESVTITDLVSNTANLEVIITNKYARIYDNKGQLAAPIPSGFTASSVAGETEIADGKVVKGPDNSEFVWVPVPNAAIDVTGMTDSNINAAISRETSLECYPMAIKVNSTDYKGVLYTFSGTTLPAIITPRKYTTNATSGYREPAYLADSSWGDASSFNTAGITEASLQTEYNSMVTSAITNGGFYIGRYQTSLNGTKAQSKQEQLQMTATPDSGDRWWGMYDKQKNYASDNSISSVTSGMIYGSQWDQVMIWMRNIANPDASNKPYIVDSTGMGWYTDNSEKSVKNTGTLPEAKVNNIFDMAGNIYEWTQEASGAVNRIIRRRQFQR